MNTSSQARSVGAATDLGNADPLADAGMALAGAFRESDALFHLAAVHDPNLAITHSQRLRDTLIQALIALGEARRARRKALSG